MIVYSFTLCDIFPIAVQSYYFFFKYPNFNSKNSPE